ncbi:hypothetical protein HDU86_000211 [Geranomyces michiganensis]|nr:hypothetical protein HDU86_000211 [Geranomyces michiganensis]
MGGRLSRAASATATKNNLSSSSSTIRAHLPAIDTTTTTTTTTTSSAAVVAAAASAASSSSSPPSSPPPQPPPQPLHAYQYERWPDIARPRPFNPATEFPGFLPPRPLGPTKIHRKPPETTQKPMHVPSVAPPPHSLRAAHQGLAGIDSSFGYGSLHPVSLAVNVSHLPPASLVPHESTNPAHLALLTRYLATIPPDTPVPLAAVTKSFPHVILDGHHRVAAARALGLKKIPVWVVDDEKEDNISGNSSDISSTSSKALQQLPPRNPEVRCFDARSGERILLKTVAGMARAGGEGFGVKGTRHVVLGPGGEMRLLEEVTPRLPWADWTCGANVTAAAAKALAPLSAGASEEPAPKNAEMFALDPPR